MELMAQLRPNGQIIDHIILVIGGDKLLEAKVLFRLLLGAEKGSKLDPDLHHLAHDCQDQEEYDQRSVV